MTATKAKSDTKYPHLRYWTRPDSYIGPDWYGWYAFLGQSRDSDDLEESNFAVGLKQVKEVMSKDSVPGDPDESATVQVVRDNHWAVGWVETIYIHESDTAALEKANELKAYIKEDYPILDESDYSNREYESFLSGWSSYGACDFRRAVKKTFGLTEAQADYLDDLDDDKLREFFCDHANITYESDSSGVNINIGWVEHSMDEDELAELLDPEFKAKQAYEAAHPTQEL